ncbi:MAG TPA: TonB-dependent receptor [Planctomycetota bacterium]
MCRTRRTLFFLCLSGAVATAQEPEKRRLVDLSIEELMKLEVTTPAKKEQRLIEVPAAMTVIRGEDLRRTGARTIPDALRAVPGLHVARIDANKWVVTSRGFSNRFSNKLQVLFDGRTVYSPLFSGVFWETQAPMIEDIDRIEVIRGPGATVWGSNAMNGVINIISRKSEDTQGGLLVGGVGTEEKDFGAARGGFASGPDFHGRVFAKYDNRDNSRDGHDSWFQARAGFRADWTPGDVDRITVEGEYYDGGFHGTVMVPELAAPFLRVFSNSLDNSGGHLLTRWERRLSPDSELAVQLSYERAERSDELLPVDIRDILEFDLTHRFTPFAGHDVTWGAGYLASWDRLEGTFTISFDPEEDRKGVTSVFVQDEITLVERRLKATLGSKFEYNEYTGFEVQPGVRLAWTPDDIETFWLSVARAVRMPSRAESDVRLAQSVQPGPVVVAVTGDEDFLSEELLAFETGYRIMPLDPLSIDLALFYNLYDQLRTLEPEAPFPEASPPPPHLIAPFASDNKLAGRTYGAELAVSWRAHETLTLHASYAFLRMRLALDDDSGDLISEDAERSSPRHQAYVRASLDLPQGLELDLASRYVGGQSAPDVSGYTELDARLGWRATSRLDLAVVGQNLLHDDHFESSDTLLGNKATRLERGVYLTAALTF